MGTTFQHSFLIFLSSSSWIPVIQTLWLYSNSMTLWRLFRSILTPPLFHPFFGSLLPWIPAPPGGELLWAGHLPRLCRKMCWVGIKESLLTGLRRSSFGWAPVTVVNSLLGRLYMEFSSGTMCGSLYGHGSVHQ